MKNISFQLTTDQILKGTKDVTRRLGWRTLKPGDRLRGVVKSQGLKPGEKIVPLAVIEVVSVRREVLSSITADDCRREGFPNLSPTEFAEMFCGHMGGDSWQEVTRIEFRTLCTCRPDEYRPGRWEGHCSTSLNRDLPDAESALRWGVEAYDENAAFEAAATLAEAQARADAMKRAGWTKQDFADGLKGCFEASK